MGWAGEFMRRRTYLQRACAAASRRSKVVQDVQRCLRAHRASQSLTMKKGGGMAWEGVGGGGGRVRRRLARRRRLAPQESARGRPGVVPGSAHPGTRELEFPSSAAAEGMRNRFSNVAPRRGATFAFERRSSAELKVPRCAALPSSRPAARPPVRCAPAHPCQMPSDPPTFASHVCTGHADGHLHPSLTRGRHERRAQFVHPGRGARMLQEGASALTVV